MHRCAFSVVSCATCVEEARNADLQSTTRVVRAHWPLIGQLTALGPVCASVDDYVDLILSLLSVLYLNVLDVLGKLIEHLFQHFCSRLFEPK